MDLQGYVCGPFAGIGGWCEAGLWQTVEAVLDVQAKLQVGGPVAEIGVHHGKFFIGLALAKKHPAGNLAIDVFDDQTFNVDKSGRGNRAVFMRNLEACGIAAEAVDVRQVDSSTLTDAEIAALRTSSGGFSLFSVDGGHLAEHAYNDLLLAMKLTGPGGVIFVDDYLNPDWPGVGEAIAKLYLMSAPMFVPFVYTANKLLLCHRRHYQDYFDGTLAFTRERYPETRISKRVMRFGYRTLAIHPGA